MKHSVYFFVFSERVAIHLLVSGAAGISGFVSSVHSSGTHSEKKKTITSIDCSVNGNCCLSVRITCRYTREIFLAIQNSLLILYFGPLCTTAHKSSNYLIRYYAISLRECAATKHTVLRFVNVVRLSTYISYKYQNG